MSDGAATGAGSTVVCERHGLRFDPERHEGCVLCRRERARGATASAASEGSAGRAWMVAVLVWAVAGAALYTAHREVLPAMAVFTGDGIAAHDAEAVFEEDAEAVFGADHAFPSEEPLDAVPYDPMLDGDYLQEEGEAEGFDEPYGADGDAADTGDPYG